MSENLVGYYKRIPTGQIYAIIGSGDHVNLYHELNEWDRINGKPFAFHGSLDEFVRSMEKKPVCNLIARTDPNSDRLHIVGNPETQDLMIQLQPDKLNLFNRLVRAYSAIQYVGNLFRK